ncbi:MAG TPA: hypothetical protein VMU98_04970 [Acidimicrobiales bacterium]|nr:hypothetical protein [Acidimicrobiales bacterium]
MTIRRGLVAVLLLAGLVVSASAVSCHRSTMPESTPCFPAALARAFHGPLALTRLDSYGCQGSWAYAWATIGSGARAVGVTEVLFFDSRTSHWRFAQRAAVCGNATLPERIDSLGCHSN